MHNPKTFAIISLGWLGDTLLNSTLCQDIKKNYPDSKLIFISSKPFVDVVRCMDCVDEVFTFDKNNEHKGIWGCFNFAKEFPYTKAIDCAFVTHAHERSILLSYAIGAKMRIAAPKKNCNPINLLITHKFKYKEEQIRNTYKADFNSDYLSLIGAKSRLSKVNLNVPEEYDINIRKKLLNNGWNGNDYIVLSPMSKDEYKDWSVDNIREFISKSEKQVVLVGTQKASDLLKDFTDVNFIDMTNKTNIIELATLIKNAKATVSVDTGTMHVSYAVGTPTICLFFKRSMIPEWAPTDRDKNIILSGVKYLDKKSKKVVMDEDISPDIVIRSLHQFL